MGRHMIELLLFRFTCSHLITIAMEWRWLSSSKEDVLFLFGELFDLVLFRWFKPVVNVWFWTIDIFLRNVIDMDVISFLNLGSLNEKKRIVNIGIVSKANFIATPHHSKRGSQLLAEKSKYPARLIYVIFFCYGGTLLLLKRNICF